MPKTYSSALNIPLNLLISDLTFYLSNDLGSSYLLLGFSSWKIWREALSSVS